jgi:hypothetical protein
VSPTDLELIHFVETADEAWAYVREYYRERETARA